MDSPLTEVQEVDKIYAPRGFKSFKAGKSPLIVQRLFFKKHAAVYQDVQLEVFRRIGKMQVCPVTGLPNVPAASQALSEV